MTTTAIRTTCPYCGVGCGVLARPGPQLAPGPAGFQIAGDPAHPANAGKLCSKGAVLGETLDDADRLLHPSIGARRVPWGEALDHVAAGFARVIREHGPDAVAFYVSGQLLTEDYYAANKLMKGYFGSANIDTNSRLCMASAVAGHKRAFGADIVPGCYEDFELADLVVLVGSNTAWCHPVLYQRIVRAKEQRPGLELVVIDPRRTPTCDLADLHLPIRAGSDVWLFAGLLAFLEANGHADTRFVDAHTSGVHEALAAARAAAGDIDEVAAACAVPAQHIRAFFERFARHERVVTAFSQGVNQSSSGTDKVNSILNCHLLTGRIGRAGMGPFSVTGQPNAMGGREVGGMANTLAAHLELENPGHQALLQGFWKSPAMAARAGLKAVDLFEAVHRGDIKALWIMATNPVVSLPNADRVREALERCELLVVSDCAGRTDTVDLAHVRLPAAAWSEKDGTVTNSERCISRQRAFRPAPGQARPDWWIITEVARRMGFGAGFGFQSARDVFVEHAQLSGLENRGTRAFDISGLAELSPQAYDALTPVQWPVAGDANVGTARLCGDGRFFHADGRARFVPTVPRGPVNAPDEEFPFVLNTGRIRDQWHTMTRTGLAARLNAHTPEPFVDLHAQDALLAGVREGELARVATRWGTFAARVRTSGSLARGACFAPIHWSAVNSSDARVGAAVNPVVDALSGEPEFKHTPARVEPFAVDWYSVLFLRERVVELDAVWWTQVRGEGFYRYELAGRKPAVGAPDSRRHWARSLLGATQAGADYLDYEDAAICVYRAAYLIDGQLQGYIAMARGTQLPSRAWLASLFSQPRISDADRRGLLAGRPLGDAPDVGPMVCSCFAVGRSSIARLIAEQGLVTCAQVGARVKAGTNCGSCLPEIRSLLAAGIAKAAAGEAAAITNS